MLINFVYYVFFSSAVMVYGLGMQKAIMKSRKPKNLLMEFCKFAITISFSSLLVYLVTVQLIKINFGEIGPFLAVLVVSVINIFIAMVSKVSSRTFIIDSAVELLCVIIGLTESASIWECLFNSLFCMISYFICIPFFYGLRKRIEMNAPTKNVKNLALLFVSIAIFVMILMAWNVSWLNKGKILVPSFN